jgi:hypothetical protein
VKSLVLGAKIGEEKGKVIGVSVKAVDSEGVHVEETFATEVKGLGRFPSGRNMGTLNVVTRPDGFFSGTGQGIFTTQKGDNVVWKCQYIGKPVAGKHKSVVIVQFMTKSQKLSWMNGLIGVEESIYDPKTMELSGTGYEWK